MIKFIIEINTLWLRHCVYINIIKITLITMLNELLRKWFSFSFYVNRICIATTDDQCSITYSTLSSDTYSFTVTGDVGAVDPALLGTSALQDQGCSTDYIVIPNPSQNNALLTSDRFCGLGLASTTSKWNMVELLVDFIVKM